jgi:hypothetical protein
LAGSEGFIVRSQIQHGVTILATNGNFIVPNELGIKRNGGMIYGAYALLEEIGFAFLHPLSPSIPPTMTLSQQHISRMQHEKQRLNIINVIESPRWPVRIWHYHSEHPLELTNYLQGWGTDDPYNHTRYRRLLLQLLLPLFIF